MTNYPTITIHITLEASNDPVYEPPTTPAMRRSKAL